MSDSDFVLLESADRYTFVIPRKVACASGMLKSMLDEEGELTTMSHHEMYFSIADSESSRLLRSSEQNL